MLFSFFPSSLETSPKVKRSIFKKGEDSWVAFMERMEHFKVLYGSFYFGRIC